MNSREEQLKEIDRLLTIMDELREQCPWDRKQTFESLRHLTIEEMYELADAILDNNLQEIKNELGDLLLHIIFYSKIGSEKKVFDIGDVATSISEKLIHRHPHIYGNVKVKDEEEVRKKWEELKLKEGKSSILEGIPNGLPSLVKAQRIQDKVATVGFNWEEPNEVCEKIYEELEELKTEIAQKNIEGIEEEFGDLLFSMINYARFLKINPDTALERTNRKFKKRFQYLESQAKKQNKELNNMTIESMEILWKEAKHKVKS